MLEPERLRDMVWQGLRAELRRPVEDLARARGEGVYAVGGLVRDLLLERPPADLDLVVEGDGIAFAEQLAARLGVALRSSPRFLTAELTVAGLRTDVSTARRERYPRPGALPGVEPAGVLEDLRRRDFTLNTLAIGVGGPTRAGLLAHPRAMADLRGRRVRVLHRRSFRDDPTRLLRAVALELKLEARMEPVTEAMARRAIEEGALETVSGNRLWVEIEASLRAPATAPRTLRRWADIGALAALFPAAASAEESAGLVADALELAERFSARRRARDGGIVPEICLLALARSWDDEARDRWIERFTPRRQLRRALRQAGPRLEAARLALAASSPTAAPSGVHRALGGLTLAELAVLGALADATGRDWVVREVEELRPTRLAIGAADLLARGALPGEALGEALERTLAAVLDGVVDRARELDYALEQLGIPDGRRGPRADPESSDP